MPRTSQLGWNSQDCIYPKRELPSNPVILIAPIFCTIKKQKYKISDTLTTMLRIKL